MNLQNEAGINTSSVFLHSSPLSIPTLPRNQMKSASFTKQNQKEIDNSFNIESIMSGIEDEPNVCIQHFRKHNSIEISPNQNSENSSRSFSISEPPNIPFPFEPPEIEEEEKEINQINLEIEDENSEPSALEGSAREIPVAAYENRQNANFNEIDYNLLLLLQILDEMINRSQDHRREWICFRYVRKALLGILAIIHWILSNKVSIIFSSCLMIFVLIFIIFGRISHLTNGISKNSIILSYLIIISSGVQICLLLYFGTLKVVLRKELTRSFKIALILNIAELNIMVGLGLVFLYCDGYREEFMVLLCSGVMLNCGFLAFIIAISVIFVVFLIGLLIETIIRLITCKMFCPCKNTFYVIEGPLHPRINRPPLNPSIIKYESNVHNIGTCHICLEDFEEKEDVCQMSCCVHHIFHKPCILKWLEEHENCPICRSVSKIR